MLNVRSVVIRAFGGEAGYLVNMTIVALTLAVLGCAIWAWRRAGAAAFGPIGLALLSVTMLLTSYDALYHTGVFSVLAFILLEAELREAPPGPRLDFTLLVGWGCVLAGPLALFLVVPSSKV